MSEERFKKYVDDLYDSVVFGVFTVWLDEVEQKGLISDLLEFYRKETSYEGDTFDARKIPYENRPDYEKRFHSLEQMFMLSNLNKVGAKELVENRRESVIRNYLKKIKFYCEQIVKCSKDISFQVAGDYKWILEFDANIRNYLKSLPTWAERERDVVNKMFVIFWEFEREIETMFNIVAVEPEKDKEWKFVKVLSKGLFFELKEINDVFYNDDCFLEGMGLFDIEESDLKGLVNSRTVECLQKYLVEFKDNMWKFSDKFYLDLYKFLNENKEEKTASKEKNVNWENINIGETGNVEEKDKMREFIRSELQSTNRLSNLINMIKLTSYWNVENRNMICEALKLRNDSWYFSVVKDNYDFFADIVDKEKIFDDLIKKWLKNEVKRNLDFFEWAVPSEKLREFRRDLIKGKTLYSCLKGSK